MSNVAWMQIAGQAVTLIGLAIEVVTQARAFSPATHPVSIVLKLASMCTNLQNIA